MSESSAKVYIVLVNYKSWQDTVECLESLFKLTYTNYTVIVVDNFSQNDSIKHLKKWADGQLAPLLNEEFYRTTSIEPSYVEKPLPYHLLTHAESTSKVEFDSKLIFIESNANFGFAGGNNQGIKLALAHKSEYIWLLNNDTVVAKDSLSNLVRHFTNTRKVGKKLGILGAKLLYYHNPNLIQAILGRYHPAIGSSEHLGLNQNSNVSFENLQIMKNDYIVGASMFVSSEFVLEVGLMSEDYFLYFEEIDWVKRGRAKNYEIDVCLEALVYHKEGASTGGAIRDNNNKSELSDFYSIRNRLIITKKFYKKYLFPVYFSLIFVFVNRVKRKQYSRLPLILKAVKSSFKGTG